MENRNRHRQREQMCGQQRGREGWDELGGWG